MRSRERRCSAPQAQPKSRGRKGVVLVVDHIAPGGLIGQVFCTKHDHRGVGLIERTSAPGTVGNLGIAGHRDGFFRVLARIRTGDKIELQTRDRLYDYRVTFLTTVPAADARLLAPTRDAVVTLVTCYPFYFVGNAPERFVVRALLITQASEAKSTRSVATSR